MKAIKDHRYRHYKGKEYIVLSIARHSETLEEMVIYEALYNSLDFGNHATWVRPRNMFEEQVEVEGKVIDRFTDISSV